MRWSILFVAAAAYASVNGHVLRSQAADASSLVEELRVRSDADQAARRELFACGSDDAERRRLTEVVRKVDRSNLAWLKGVVERHGWPGKSLVGPDGAHRAWLLVQHADADRAFQELCLRKMRRMVPGEVTAGQVAYLTDRLLVARGKKQIFGTQAAVDGKTLKPFPIADRPNVDRRRREAGLEPLTDYLHAMERLYARPDNITHLPSERREH